MSDFVLDDQAYINLRELQPGDLFTLRGNERCVCECVKVEHPVEHEPWVRAWEMEGPKQRLTKRQFRAIRISLVDRIIK